MLHDHSLTHRPSIYHIISHSTQIYPILYTYTRKANDVSRNLDNDRTGPERLGFLLTLICSSLFLFILFYFGYIFMVIMISTFRFGYRLDFGASIALLFLLTVT